MRLRIFWLFLGFLATACGMAGAILPLVPATPFLLVAAYAFARSSPRLHAWLMAHPHFGRLISNWQQHRSIDVGAKTAAVLAMAATFAMSWLLGMSATVLAIQASVLTAAAVFVRPRTGMRSPPQPDHRPIDTRRLGRNTKGKSVAPLRIVTNDVVSASEGYR